MHLTKYDKGGFMKENASKMYFQNVHQKQEHACQI